MGEEEEEEEEDSAGGGIALSGAECGWHEAEFELPTNLQAVPEILDQFRPVRFLRPDF